MATPENAFLDTKIKIRAGSIQCKKTRDLKILKTIDKLKEACECDDTNCPNADCDDMKSLVVHSKFCTVHPKKCCHLCKNLLAMCRYHAKRSRDCDSQHCSVPYCAEIKHTLMLKNKQNENKGVIYICNKCKQDFKIGYNCTVCVDFEMCVFCYELENHPHMMNTISFHLDEGGQKRTNSQDAQKLTIQPYIDYFVHVLQCKDVNCRLTRCTRLKQVINHSRMCIRRKPTGSCLICKQLIALCCIHAKRCQESKCLLGFCSNMKIKLKRQELQQRLQQAQLLRRRMTVINRGSLRQMGTPWNQNGLEEEMCDQNLLESLIEEPLNLSVQLQSTSSNTG